MLCRKCIANASENGVGEIETGCIQENFWKQDLWKFLMVVKEKNE